MPQHYHDVIKMSTDRPIFIDYLLDLTEFCINPITSDLNSTRKIIESLPHPFYVIDIDTYTIQMANTATSVFGKLEAGVTCYTLTHNQEKPCKGV